MDEMGRSPISGSKKERQSDSHGYRRGKRRSRPRNSTEKTRSQPGPQRNPRRDCRYGPKKISPRAGRKIPPRKGARQASSKEGHLAPSDHVWGSSTSNRGVRLPTAQSKSGVRRYNSDSSPPGEHGHFHAAQNLQGISISRLPPDVVRGLYLKYWHLDADRGPGLADLSPEPFGFSVGA